jgi:hypothetical protein
MALQDLLPPSLAAPPEVAGVTSAVSPILAQLDAETEIPNLIARLDELSGEVLAALAEYFGVRFWTHAEAPLPDERLRTFIRLALVWHFRRGTVWSVYEVLRILGFSAAIVHEYSAVAARAFAAGVRRVDGDWSVGDVGVFLLPFEAAGLPTLHHWAEFVIELCFDTDASAAAEFGAHIARAVEGAAPARSRAVFLLRYTPSPAWSHDVVASLAASLDGYAATPFPEHYTHAFTNPPADGSHQSALILRPVARGFDVSPRRAADRRAPFRGFEPEDRPLFREEPVPATGDLGTLIQVDDDEYVLTLDLAAEGDAAGFVADGDDYALATEPASPLQLTKWGGGLALPS